MTKIIPQENQTSSNIRDVPFRTLVKGTVMLLLAPAILLLTYFMYDLVSTRHIVAGALFLFGMAIILVRPYIANLSALTYYVRQLAQEQKASPPDLSFLNNVEELSAAVAELHDSWELRRRRLESTITENEVLINSLPEIIVMLDGDGQIVRTNMKAHQIFGMHQVETSLREVLTRPEMAAPLRQTQEDGQGRTVPLYIPVPVDRHFMVNIERFPLFRWGKIVLIVVMVDITDQKLTEQMLSDFVANASHEIRTPLTSLKGFIETLQTSVTEDPASTEKFLNIMADQAERMAHLVNGLLSLSKIQRNLHTLPQDTVDVLPVLQQVVRQYEMPASARGMTLMLNINTPLQPVRGDAHELMQVFENIIQNAIKYANPNTMVRVSASCVPNSRPRDHHPDTAHILMVEVVDEGEGIAPEHLPRLTERFYRVDTARSRKAGGTGLGLAIVKHILNRHRGALETESIIGQGSVFRVLLPVVEGASNA